MEQQRKPYIVCVGENGRAVLFGWCDSEPKPGENIRVHDAHMVLYWPSGGLLGLASKGPTSGARITAAVEWVEPGPVKQVLAVSQAAAEALKSWPSA